MTETYENRLTPEALDHWYVVASAAEVYNQGHPVTIMPTELKAIIAAARESISVAAEVERATVLQQRMDRISELVEGQGENYMTRNQFTDALRAAISGDQAQEVGR